jgi:uncharacterized protein involved in exopolysaccharide biosynthesis
MPEVHQGNGYRDPDSFDVRGAFRSIVASTRQHKLLIAICCSLSLAATTVYVMVFPPIYTASARVMVEKAIDNSRDAFYGQWDAFRKDDPRTEIELITAPGIVAEVIKKDNLKYADVYHPVLSTVRHLWTESWPGKTYHKAKEYFFPKKIDPNAPSLTDIEFAKTVVDMKQGITMIPVADSEIGELTLKGPNYRVGKIANSLLKIYLDRRRARYQAEAQQNLDALDNEVKLAAADAQDISNRRLAYAKANDLTFDFAKETQQLTKMVDLEDNLASNKAKAATLEASLHLVESDLAKEPDSRTSSRVDEVNAAREALKVKLLDFQTQLITLQGVYREDSPEVQEVRQNIAAVQKLIAAQPEKLEKASTTSLNSLRQDLSLSADSLRSQLAGVKAGLTVMEDTDRALRKRMSNIPDIQNTMRDFDRQYALVADRYQALSAKRAQAAVSLAMAKSATPSMQVVQWATDPAEPAWPKLKILYPSALLVGLLLGVLGAQILRLLSGRVHKEDLEQDSPIYSIVRIPIGTHPFSVRSPRRTVSNQKES